MADSTMNSDAPLPYVNVTGSPYSIDITMSPTTVSALANGRYQLFMFKAVQSAVGGGKPTVWSATSRYSALTKINWTEQYYAYASTQEIRNGVNFMGSDTAQINLGQFLDVSANALVSVSNGGTPQGITARNLTTTPFTTGLAQPGPGGSEPAPVCAFPLYGKNMDLMIPLQKVALVFAAAPLEQGMVIESSIGPAVLVDLTTQNAATLQYDINKGWSWTGNVASDIPADQFVQTLIVPTTDSADSPASAFATEPVRSIGIWTPSSARWYHPINLIATSESGFTDANSLACRLTPVADNAPPVVRGGIYLATYRNADNTSEMWQVKCTYVPGSPDNPYDFAKIQRADDL
ncbi:hypothetical protein [Actinacidiphila acidipaludis]|uniref:Uncharacterized protein n=1 Tax=Actinacidiphila acidipaludis TaxID=2873382 RepID=A0ABS7QHL5_9ACTN|nr:hypothetical protein [Streptomyces acidipaludis]MBY8882665.1 hypothetical protein [Streptomyces acidipaludis]